MALRRIPKTGVGAALTGDTHVPLLPPSDVEVLFVRASLVAENKG